MRDTLIHVCYPALGSVVLFLIGRPRFAVLGSAVIGLSACATEALPRDASEDAGSGTDSRSDVRTDGTNDASRVDASDSASRSDASEAANLDATDGQDDIDADDVPTSVDASDATARDVNDTDTTVDANDSATRSDASDSGRDAPDAPSGIDANDTGVPVDANDAGEGGYASEGGDSSSSDTGPADATDGGFLVFYEENFNSGIGSFVSEEICGLTPPVWSNIGPGYAHASEPALTGVSRIFSPAIEVPPNTFNVRLRMRHRFDIESGWDGAQLLISINGATPPTQVNMFTVGGYNGGQHPDPETCSLVNLPNRWAAWSGTQAEFESEVNLSTEFGVVPGNTISILFRMTVDAATPGSGWDINWVRLTANTP